MTIGYILVALAVVEAIIGLYFLVRYEKTLSAIFYGLFCVGIAAYVFANGIGYNGIILSGDGSERLAWIGVTLLTSAFLGFSQVFPFPRKRLADMLPSLLWPNLLFSPLFLFTDLIVEKTNIQHYSDGFFRIAGPLYLTYLLFFTTYWIWILINLTRSFRSSVGFQHWQLSVLLFGSTISLVFALFFDIILPQVTANHFSYVGSLLSTVWLGATTYILVKR